MTGAARARILAGMEKLKEWMAITETSGRRLADDLGVSHQTVYNWLDGTTSPYGPQLRKLHELTRIPLEYLVPPLDKDHVA